jgi:hypothetical protein
MVRPTLAPDAAEADDDADDAVLLAAVDAADELDPPDALELPDDPQAARARTHGRTAAEAAKVKVVRRTEVFPLRFYRRSVRPAAICPSRVRERSGGL